MRTWFLVAFLYYQSSLACGVSYALCLSAGLMQCRLYLVVFLVDVASDGVLLILSRFFLWLIGSLSLLSCWGFCNPLYLGSSFTLNPGITCLVMCILG